MGAKGKGKRRVVGATGAAFAASVFVVPERSAATEREPYRVPCVHRLANPDEGCADRFAPNGIGSAAHTTCPEGRATLAAMRAARDAGLEPRQGVFDAMNAIREAHGVKLAVQK